MIGLERERWVVYMNTAKDGNRLPVSDENDGRIKTCETDEKRKINGNKTEDHKNECIPRTKKTTEQPLIEHTF